MWTFWSFVHIYVEFFNYFLKFTEFFILQRFLDKFTTPSDARESMYRSHISKNLNYHEEWYKHWRKFVDEMFACANYLKDFSGVEAHMQRHAEILKPKFNAVLDAFDAKLAGKGIAQWTKPNGGYFISLDVYEGCAKRTVALCKEAGVTLTGAGATFPYGKDPEDKNIRIAPTFPSRDELCKAVEILCLCVEISAIEKILG